LLFKIYDIKNYLLILENNVNNLKNTQDTLILHAKIIKIK